MILDSKAINAEPESVPVEKIPDLILTLRYTLVMSQYKGFTCFDAIVPKRIAILRGRYAAKFGQILASTL